MEGSTAQEERHLLIEKTTDASVADSQQVDPSPISPQDDSDHGYFSPGHETEAEPEPGLRGVPVRCESYLRLRLIHTLIFVKGMMYVVLLQRQSCDP